MGKLFVSFYFPQCRGDEIINCRPAEIKRLSARGLSLRLHFFNQNTIETNIFYCIFLFFLRYRPYIIGECLRGICKINGLRETVLIIGAIFGKRAHISYNCGLQFVAIWPKNPKNLKYLKN